MVDPRIQLLHWAVFLAGGLLVVGLAVFLIFFGLLWTVWAMTGDASEYSTRHTKETT